MDTDPTKDLSGDIAQHAANGNYLVSKNTRLTARSSEFYYPALTDRHSFDSWVNLGKPTMYKNARERVEEILATPMVDQLPESVSNDLNEILNAADKELAVNQ